MEDPTMRSTTLTLTGAAMVAALLIGCDADSTPTAQTTPGVTADATDHNVADHFKSVEAVTFSDGVNPCNGEQITFTGTVESQVTVIGTRGMLDAGNYLHREYQQHVRATGTGSVTGATYTINDIFHESFNSPNVPAPHLTLGDHATTHVTSDLPGLSFKAHFVFHLVVPSGKDFKVTTLLDRVTCS
ncbi:MAG: hypothetical protein ABIQ49_06050 [Gemmatimonadales bacterium]